MSQEMMFLEQLFGRSGSAWLPMTMLAGLLVALIFRPHTIHNLSLFRAACWLLSLSLILTPLLSLLLQVMMSTFSGNYSSYGPSSIGSPILYACTNSIGPVMQGASILCGLFSLVPPIGSRQNVAASVKHPLE